MLRLEINNSTSTIHGLTVEQYRSLRQQLSYKVQGAYFSGDPTGGVRYLINKRGELSTGLCARVIAWAKASKLPLQLDDQRKRPTGRLGALNAKLPFTPYPTQVLASAACHAHHRGYVQMPTGSGKSVAIALTIDAIKVRTLVVVPSMELKRQLTESLSAAFGKKNVGELGKNIAVMNIQALNSKVNRDFKGYDAVIIDEYHHSAASSYRKLNSKCWNDIYYRFGYTATPWRGQEEEQVLMESLIGEKIYALSYAQAVKLGQIAPIEAYYVDVPKITTTSHTWAGVYKDLVVNNHLRNMLITRLLEALEGKSTLCLVKEVAHGLVFSSYPYAHGENQDTSALIKDFNKGGSTLIATTGVCGEGIDSRPCEFVIIAGLGKSKPAFLQQCGRAFRTWPGKESGKIIIFRDLSHRWSKAHYRAQCQILKDEFNCIPVKLDI